MNVLVVYAHPNPSSFNHAVLESFTRGLKEGGHTFEIEDLYGSNFYSCLKAEDFAQFAGKQMPKDVVEQQEKITRADALAFIYPTWCWSPPAIMKGWFDRVISVGFAYKYGPRGMEGLLTHSKVLIISTTGGNEAGYKASGIEDAVKRISKAIFTDVCGIQNSEHVLLYSVPRDPEARKTYLELAYRLGKEF